MARPIGPTQVGPGGLVVDLHFSGVSAMCHRSFESKATKSRSWASTLIPARSWHVALRERFTRGSATTGEPSGSFQPPSQPNSKRILLAMASNLLGMASTLITMASNLIAMACNLLTI